MNPEKIKAELLGGPQDGHSFECFPCQGSFIAATGKYIRTDEKTKSGRVIFRWVFNQKGVSA